MPSAVKENLENLGYKVQELLVLCNRSLFLADDLNNRLENQQDRLLQQEVEQLATLEAILIANREIARSMGVENLFDLKSTQRVVKNALTMANGFRLSRNERQSLYYAALLKDLGLVAYPQDMVEQMVVPTHEQAVAISVRFNLVWKTLSRVDFLSTPLTFISHRYERYDGKGYPFGIKGNNIPLGARILAVADTFDTMTSGLWPRGTLAPRTAVQKLVAESGKRFDPDVVSALVRAWRRAEFYVASLKQ
jgi:response regulator RpfG family c-di-GMP phosphodiesterase